MIEVQPTTHPTGDGDQVEDVESTSESEESAKSKESSKEQAKSLVSTDNSYKNVYIMSDIKWGVHSDIERRKGKYWYLPGPVKEYYCYLKQVSAVCVTVTLNR